VSGWSWLEQTGHFKAVRPGGVRGAQVTSPKAQPGPGLMQVNLNARWRVCAAQALAILKPAPPPALFSAETAVSPGNALLSGTDRPEPRPAGPADRPVAAPDRLE